MDSVVGTTAEDTNCLVRVVFSPDFVTSPLESPPFVLMTLRDFIDTINLRNVSIHGRNSDTLTVPIALDNSTRVLVVIIERLVLVPGLPMVTAELRKKAPATLILTVQPPPHLHFTFRKKSIVKVTHNLIGGEKEAEHWSSTDISSELADQLTFPTVDGQRGVIVGKTRFRKKCARHAAQFIRCRCVLPLVSTPAYVDALALALLPSANAEKQYHYT